MTHPTPHCEQCRYFQPLDAMSGQCHRFPPQFAGDNSPREIHHWRFPTVSAHAWCGEYLPQPTDQMSSTGVSI